MVHFRPRRRILFELAAPDLRDSRPLRIFPVRDLGHGDLAQEAFEREVLGAKFSHRARRVVRLLPFVGAR